MANIENYFGTLPGIPLPLMKPVNRILGVGVSNFPAIGEPVLDVSEKYFDAEVAVHDLLLADGALVNELTHPLLYEELKLPTRIRQGGVYDMSEIDATTIFDVNVDSNIDMIHSGVTQVADGDGEFHALFASNEAHALVGNVNTAIVDFELTSTSGNSYILVTNEKTNTNSSQGFKALFIGSSLYLYFYAASGLVYDINVGAKPGRQMLIMSVDADNKFYASFNGVPAFSGQMNSGLKYATLGDAGLGYSGGSARLVKARVHHAEFVLNYADYLDHEAIFTGIRNKFPKLPVMVSPDPAIPYRIVADLTEEVP